MMPQTKKGAVIVPTQDTEVWVSALEQAGFSDIDNKGPQGPGGTTTTLIVTTDDTDRLRSALELIHKTLNTPTHTRH